MPGHDVELLRTLHGRSTVAWVGSGTHVVGGSHWLALSGASHVDYNLALCHGPGGAAQVAGCLERITATRRPSIIALAGEARRSTALTDAGWTRVGGAPLMVRGTSGTRADPAVRRLEPAELTRARDLVGAVFGLPDDIAEVALTADPDAVPGREVWGLIEQGRLITAVILMRVDTSVVVWSMATSPAHRRRGHGRRTLDTALAQMGEHGIERFVLHASADGEPLYRAAGFETVEHWDFWSRRRWVLAGA